MDVVFESKNILYVRPSFDLIPDYLEMVNDIENVARFIGERREPYTEEEERSYMQSKMDQHATMSTPKYLRALFRIPRASLPGWTARAGSTM